jgi:hypothetical protein
VERGGGRAEDGRLLLVVRDALAGKVGRAALGDLEDDRRLDVPAALGSDPRFFCERRVGGRLTERPRARRWRRRRR